MFFLSRTLSSENLTYTDLKQYIEQTYNVFQTEIEKIICNRNSDIVKIVDNFNIKKLKAEDIEKIINENYKNKKFQSCNLYQLIPILNKQTKCGMCEDCINNCVCFNYLTQIILMLLEAKIKGFLEVGINDLWLILQMINISESCCIAKKTTICESSSNNCVGNESETLLSGIETREYGKNYGKKV